jgi:hypothetical protein
VIHFIIGNAIAEVCAGEPLRELGPDRPRARVSFESFPSFNHTEFNSAQWVEKPPVYPVIGDTTASI